MRLYTEEEAFKKAGAATLTDTEVLDVAASVARQCTGIVTRCLITGKFRELQNVMKRYTKEAAEKKALEAWIRGNCAVYDPHRKKWIVLDDLYDGDPRYKE